LSQLIKFKSLFDNLLADIITSETRLAEFGVTGQYNNGTSTNNQLCYQNENSNDVAYWKVIVDAAEQFFNRTKKELEQACINRVMEAFITGSMTSQLAKKSILDSNDILPIRACGNEKEDPLQ
jgi:hypothetical protein